MQALVDANAAFGGDNDKFHRAAIAIQQMAGKGVISMEELRQQMGEAVPRAIELMARSLGVSYGELVKEISKGTVAARPALQAMFDEFQRVYGGSALRMMETYSGQFSRFITNVKKLLTQNSGMTAYFEEVKTQLKDLNTFLESPAAANFANNLGEALASMVRGLRNAIEFFWEWKEAIATAGKVMALYWGANQISNIIRGFATMTTAVTGQVALWRTLRSEMMQTAIASVRAQPSFAAPVGPIVRLNNVVGKAPGLLSILGRGFTSLLGPVGLAVSGIWMVVDVLDIFGDKHRQLLKDILDGQKLVNEEQRKEGEVALQVLQDNIVKQEGQIDSMADAYQRAGEKVARFYAKWQEELKRDPSGQGGWARQAEIEYKQALQAYEGMRMQIENQRLEIQDLKQEYAELSASFKDGS